MEASIGELIEPLWPPKSLEGIKKLANSHDLLNRWMMKTACVAQASGVLKKQILSANKMRLTKSATPTDCTRIYAAFIKEQNLDIRLEKGFRVWENGKLDPNREHHDGYSFAIQMNHFAIRLLQCPEAEVIHVMPYGEHRPTLPIPVTIGSVHSSLDCNTYDNMNDFYNSFEIQLKANEI